MRNRLRIALIAMMLLSVDHGLAQTASEASPAQVRAAAEAFDRGREAYKSGDPVVAAEAFELADSKAASPVALEYAIRSRDKAGQLDRAATLAALAKARYSGEAMLEKLADEVLSRARTELYEVEVTCSEPCDLVVDGKLVHGRADFERVVFLADGDHILRAGFAQTRSASKTVQAASGQQGEVRFDAPVEEAIADTPETDEPLVEAPVTKTPPAEVDSAGPREESSGWSPAVFWAGAGLTAVLGGVTLWSGLDTVKNPGEDKVRDSCRNDEPDCRDLYEDGKNRQDRTNLLLGITGGVGLATIIIGAAATDWGDESEQPENLSHRPQKQARITPFVSLGNGALVGAEGRF
jgi:hypothetical protein